MSGDVVSDGIEVAEALQRPSELCVLHPYLCPAGVPTIGYGATYYEDGTRVTLFDPPITHERAEQLLRWMNETVYAPALVAYCPELDTANRFGAILDLEFNIGKNALKHSSLRRAINKRQWSRVPSLLMKWVHGGGRVLPGLVRRRKAECALFDQ